MYKNKVEELAHVRYDEEVDTKFYAYLEKLVNAEEYAKKLRYDGVMIMRELITKHDSVTMV